MKNKKIQFLGKHWIALKKKKPNKQTKKKQKNKFFSRVCWLTVESVDSVPGAKPGK